jgi:hypothetical protein
MFIILLLVFNYKGHFFFCLDAKETKDQALIFIYQKSSDRFPYRDPSRSCFTLDSGVTPFGQRANPYRDFLVYKYKGGEEDVFMSLLLLLILKRIVELIEEVIPSSGGEYCVELYCESKNT